MRTRLGLLVSSAVLCSSAFAQSVAVALSSPQNGMNVSPGATINWTISFTVSTGDNLGLALLVVDLEQDGANPATLDIPPAGSVPAPMANFSRPAGISNPGESNPATGYIGVQRGASGAMNLRQIGGAQNTFGVAKPGGTGVAENANVVGGIGQSGAVTLASGSFSAPGAAGTYTYNLTNAVANVIETLNSPPNHSPVDAAATDTSSGTISFTVGGGGCVGDLNGDNSRDLTDLAIILSNFGTTIGATPEDGDTDGDGDVDLTDLAVILSVFGTPCP